MKENAIFIPSKQSLFLIYGVGSAIDFVQENPTAKQLPEKALKYLDKLADSYLNNEKEEEK